METFSCPQPERAKMPSSLCYQRQHHSQEPLPFRPGVREVLHSSHYHSSRHDTGVSEVAGEMLMIALVVVLLSVFSAALFTFLPDDRDPSTTVMMHNDRQNITLWHKGGDPVRYNDLTVVVTNGTERSSFSGALGEFTCFPEKPVFDLGSNITARLPGGLEGNETVKLVTPHTVIFTGRVGL